jgi:putative transposase
MIEPVHPKLSVTRQCELLGLPRSSFYYQPQPVSAEQLRLMRAIDELYLAYPFYGSRQMTRALRREGYGVIGRKRVQRLMRLMGLEAIYQKPNLSRANAAHKIYPYLLRKLAVTRPNQVWATDITYVPIQGGFIYLCAVIDWFSRRVLAWELSNTLDAAFCVRAVERAIANHGAPEIFNTDQGCQFTSVEFTRPLLDLRVKLSMDGKGRALDNVFVERLWRTVKYERLYLFNYVSLVDVHASLEVYFEFYNHRRPHSSLDDRTPDEAYRSPLPQAVNQ